MTARERFLRWADYETNDIPAWGDWLGPYDFWLPQGLPPAPPEEQADPTWQRDYFARLFRAEGVYSAYWGTSRVPVNTGLCPGFRYEELSRDATHVIVRDADGVVCKKLITPNSTLIATEYLSHPLRGPENWDEFRRTQLDPDDPRRYPSDEEWAALRQKWPRDRDHILTIDGGSFYGIVRNWMGVENISYAFYDEPDWMHEVMDYLADFYCAVLRRALCDFDVDVALFWEDMCFKNGPLISPDMFREFLLEPYKKVTAFLAANGVRVSFVDCDGNIEALLPLWIEGGVRGFYPLEVASGMEPLPLLQKYERDRILLWGGVDKREIARGGEAIDRELDRLAPAVAFGHYIPLIDHGVPEDISYRNYCEYDRKRRERFGIVTL